MAKRLDALLAAQAEEAALHAASVEKVIFLLKRTTGSFLAEVFSRVNIVAGARVIYQ